MKTWTELVSLLLAAVKWFRFKRFKEQEKAALENTEITDGDTSKEEDILRRGGG